MPTVTFFGHAAVGLAASDGTQLIVDPHGPEVLDGRLGYSRIPVRPEFAVCTHAHADHSAVETLEGPAPKRIDEGRAGAFEISRHTFAHDEYDGRRFGGQVDVLAIEVDDLTLVHASDVGESPGRPLPDELRRPDLLFVPVGGFYTIGAAQAWEWCRRIDPRIILPIHYATPATKLPLQGLTPFTDYDVPVEYLDRATFELREGLPRLDGSIVVLEPANSKVDN